MGFKCDCAGEAPINGQYVEVTKRICYECLRTINCFVRQNL